MSKIFMALTVRPKSQTRPVYIRAELLGFANLGALEQLQE